MTFPSYHVDDTVRAVRAVLVANTILGLLGLVFWSKLGFVLADVPARWTVALYLYTGWQFLSAVILLFVRRGIEQGKVWPIWALGPVLAMELPKPFVLMILAPWSAILFLPTPFLLITWGWATMDVLNRRRQQKRSQTKAFPVSLPSFTRVAVLAPPQSRSVSTRTPRIQRYREFLKSRR